jgi:type I restriction enzyme, S subunit
MMKIPEVWALTKFSDVVEVIRGVTYKKNQSSAVAKDDLLPVLRANNIQGGKLIFDDLVYVVPNLIKPKQMVKKGDIVVAMSSGSKSVVGKTAKAENDFNGGFGAFCGLLRPNKLVDSSLVSFFTGSGDYRNKVSELSAGANINNLKPRHFDEVLYPLPPAAEQQVIADKLDTLLAQVETTKARLESTLETLKQFRQSVLAAAVSGKLTEDWRGTSELIKWKPVKLKSFVNNIEAGKNLKCIETPPKDDEYGIIKISAVTWGTYDEEQSKTLPRNDLFIESRRIMVGDFLISRANTIELLGNPVIVNRVTKNLMLSDKVLRLVMNDEDKPWISIFLRSVDGRREIESRSTGNQMSMRNIGQKALLDIDLPKAPELEQAEIVKRVNTLFSGADVAEQQVNQALERVNNLTQSILAKAFRGELTEQWRKDNPDLISGDNSAEALLKKIKAEREAVKPKHKTKK